MPTNAVHHGLLLLGLEADEIATVIGTLFRVALQFDVGFLQELTQFGEFLFTEKVLEVCVGDLAVAVQVNGTHQIHACLQ